MKVRLAFQRAKGDPVDLVITADATATIGDVARSILEADPLGEGMPDRDASLTLQIAPPDAPKPTILDPATLVGDAAIGSGFDAAVVLAPEHPVGPLGERGAAAAVLRITRGPDAGLTMRLPAGSSTIGRGGGNSVPLTDPLVSNRHARIEVTASSIDVIDLNSANGILVDGGLVPRLRLPSGQSLVLGDTEVSIALLAQVDELSDGILERGGSLLFNRSPRVESRYLGQEFPSPEVPSEKDSPPFSWIIMAAPVLMGVMMFFFTGNPRSLGFIALAPLMAVGNFVAQRSRVGKKTKVEIERFELQIEDLEDQATSEAPKERATRLTESPSVAEVYAEAHRLGPMLWTRRPEHWNFLDLRLGLGAMPSRNTIADRGAGNGLPLFTRRIDELRERIRFIPDVPVVENPFLCGALGVCGPRIETADAARAFLVQLAGLHSPSEVAFAALLTPASTPEFEWLKWLPHTTSPHNPISGVPLADSAATGTALLNTLEELVDIRRAELGVRESRRGAGADADAAAARGSKVGSKDAASVFSDGGAALVVLIANDAPVDRARLVQIVEKAADAHVFPIWMSPTADALPAACRTFVEVTAGDLDASAVHFVRQGMVVENVRIEGVSADYARMLARRLAPLVDAGAVVADSSDLPRSVSLVGLLGTEVASGPQSAIDRWKQNNSIHDRSGRPPVSRKRAGTLRALVGQSSPDAMHLDLRTQGPHALVGGTTGAGKSEFLQAWVLGMAAEYSPDRVTFLFVDYKGGSAFAECVSLPHCVGLVTDLSPHLVRRALTSLRAELHHREHLFNRKKAKDLLELEKRGDPECPPALVLVIDEFAALAGEVPEFVDGVVDIAQRGRSLGIHLIMATQRPAGVIKDNLRANTNLRVALRMADESDSKDVVGDPVAGTFDPGIPGRGIAKTGPGRLTPFQSGYAGGWTTDEPEVASVTVAELRFGALAVWEPLVHDSGDESADPGPNDQKRLVSAFITAAVDAGIPAPRRPWLDELPTAVDIEDLPVEGDSQILIGKADIAARQLQEPLYFVPDRDGAMLVYGTSGSGKSTVLRSLAIAAGMRPQLGSVEVFALDFGSGALRSLDVLPHVGSVIVGDDAERVQRLLRTISETLDARAKRFSEVNASSLTEYRQITGTAEPRILILIDGFGQFRSDWDSTTARIPFYNVFMRILGEGRQLGVHVVASADRSGSVPTAVSANITKRIVLRMADETAYGTLGVAKDILSEQSPPGRAVVDGLETQLAVLGGTSNVAEQSKHLARLAAELRSRGARDVPEVGALPMQLVVDDLPASLDGEPVLGVADDTLGPRGFEATGTFSVTGPPQSGKTNTMKAIITAMTRLDPEVKLFHFGGRRSQLRTFAPWIKSATSVDDARALAKELNEVISDESIPGRILIVVESVTQFSDSDAERPMKEMFQGINRSDHFLIGDADISALTSGYGFVGDFKAGRRGIALQPDAYDGDSVYKVPFPKVKRSDFPVGRGIFVQNGRIVTVQVPLVESDVAAAIPVGSAPH